MTLPVISPNRPRGPNHLFHPLALRLLGAVVPAGLVLARWLWPSRPLDAVGSQALWDAAFSVVLAGYLLLLAMAFGERLGRGLWRGVTRLESAIFAAAAGLGALGQGMLLLGLAGWASREIIIAAVVVIGWFLGPAMAEAVRGIGQGASRAWNDIGRCSRSQKVILGFAVAVGAVAFLLALAPPAGYDALMYHLLVPDQLLESHTLPAGLEDGNWHAAGPLGAEMLFAMALAFGSIVAPQLLHLGVAILFGLTTVAMARRFIGEGVAWGALALLLTMPILPFWASHAHTDFFWSLYELLAVYAFLLWWGSRSDASDGSSPPAAVAGRRRRWLVLAGLMSGLALSTKYLALAGVTVIAVFILAKRAAEVSWKGLLADLGTYVGLSLGISLAWYVKNWAWLGNPIYPFFLGGGNLSPQLLVWIGEYHASFGFGEGVWRWVLLPWNLYAHHQAFGAVWNGLDFLSPLFPLLLALPLLERQHQGWWTRLLLGMTGLRFLLWASASQQIRFLLPIVPLLCVGTARVLAQWEEVRWGGVAWRLPARAVLIATVALSCGLTGWGFLHLNPLPVIAGIESQDAYLREHVGTYPALSYLNDHASEGSARVFLVADGRGYYCPVPCRPDFSQGAWVNLVETHSGLAAVAEILQDEGYTHILVSWEDLDFLLQHDPRGRLERSIRRFVDEFVPVYLREVYHDGQASIYEWRR
ncbi:MAG: hypothetical protein ACUVXG_01630 [Anaerolineae bacterium]